MSVCLRILVLSIYLIPYGEHFHRTGKIVLLKKLHENCSEAATTCPLNNSHISSELDQEVQFYRPLNKVPQAILHCFLRRWGRDSVFSRAKNSQIHKSEQSQKPLKVERINKVKCRIRESQQDFRTMWEA